MGRKSKRATSAAANLELARRALHRFTQEQADTAWNKFRDSLGLLREDGVQYLYPRVFLRRVDEILTTGRIVDIRLVTEEQMLQLNYVPQQANLIRDLFGNYHPAFNRSLTLYRADLHPVHGK
jgi:hypothetical protein